MLVAAEKCFGTSMISQYDCWTAYWQVFSARVPANAVPAIRNNRGDRRDESIMYEVCFQAPQPARSACRRAYWKTVLALLAISDDEGEGSTVALAPSDEPAYEPA